MAIMIYKKNSFLYTTRTITSYFGEAFGTLMVEEMKKKLKGEKERRKTRMRDE